MATKSPTFTVAGSSIWARKFPKTTATIEIIKSLIGLVVATVRFLWPYRLEITLAAVPVVAWWILSDEYGHHQLFAYLVLAAAVGLFIYPTSRQYLVGILRVAQVKRWLNTAMNELRLANSSGKLPKITCGEST